MNATQATKKRRATDLPMAEPQELRLADIPLRESVELVRIDLPADEAVPLLELGLMPGCAVCPVRMSPFGDPVLEVDGALIALRREMANCLCVRRAMASGAN